MQEHRSPATAGTLRRDLLIFPLLLVLAVGIGLYPAATLGLPGFTISLCLFAALGFFIRQRFWNREMMVDEEREDLQAQIHEAQVNYQSIFENAAQGIFQSTPEGSFITANPALVKMLGMRSEAELIEEMEDWPGCHYFSDSVRWAEMMRYIELQDSVADFEAEVIRKDGRTIWVSQNVHAVRDLFGKIRYLEGTIFDITERRWAERRRSLQYSSVRILAECASMTEARPRILRTICEILEWEIGAVWEVVVSDNNLRCVEIWHRQGIEIDEVENSALEIAFAEEGSLAGKVWQEGEPNWLVNFPAEASSLNALVGSRYGMKSVFGIPIKVAGEVTHVLEFFSGKATQPDPELLQMLGVIASQIGHLVERKQADEALRDTVVRKTAILESALEPIVTFDRQGRVIEWNPAAERTFGFRRVDAIGRQLSELILPEAAQIGPSGGLPLYAATAGFGRKSEIVARRASGEEFPAEIAIAKAPIQGHPFYTAYLRDITEGKRAADLRQWVNVFHSTSDEATITTTAEGTIEAWSPGAERLFGYQAGEVIGRRLEVLSSFEQRDELLEELERIVNGEVVQNPKCVRARRDGSPIVLRWKGAPIRNERGLVTRLLFIASEVGETVHSPQGIHLQSQKMEAIGRLAGGVAHDFNNILTAILGYADLLATQVETGSAAHESAIEICNAGQFASSITRQLLAFSRGQSQELRVLDLGSVLSQINPMLRRLIGENVQLDLSVGEQPYFVKADVGELEQVIMNLVINARDAMPGEGRITISTALRTITEENADPALGVPAGEWIELTVADTGLGMSEAVKRHVFEPFFTTKKRGRGTGLGLATCYGIVRHSGGYITCESAPGKGTTFHIFLPRIERNDSAVTDIEEAGRVEALCGTETILLVEEEEAVRRIAAGTLKQFGYTVLEAESAAVARDLLAATPTLKPDLLIADVVESGGKSLAVWIREVAPETAVLLVSGYMEEAVLGSDYDLSVVAHLQKPYTPTGLARKVRETLSLGRR